MFKTESKDIDGFRYEVTQMPAGEGLQIMARVMNLLSGLSKGDGSGGTVEERVLSRLGGLIADPKLAEHLEVFCRVFSKYTAVQFVTGEKPQLNNVFDLHFAGRYKALIEWLAFSLQVNFGPIFLAAFRSAGDTAAKVP